MSTENIIHSIHVFTGIDESVCREAAQEVGEFYAQSQSPDKTIETLYLYLTDGQENRMVVHQFRQITNRLLKVMTLPEYEELASSFQEMSLDVDDLRKRCQSIERAYPKLTREQMFIDLSNALFTAMEQVNSLQDYIRHATDENWRQE